MKSKVIQQMNYGVLEFESSLLTIRFNEDCVIDEEIIESVFKEGEKLSRSNSFAILADVRSNATANISAMKFASNNPYSHSHLAYATLVKTPSVSILTNFFIRVVKPKVPSKHFYQEEETLLWVRSFI